MKIISAFETSHSSTAQTAKQNKTETSETTSVDQNSSSVRKNRIKLQWTRRGNNRMESEWKCHDVTDKEEKPEQRESPWNGENHMVFPMSENSWKVSLFSFGNFYLKRNCFWTFPNFVIHVRSNWDAMKLSLLVKFEKFWSLHIFWGVCGWNDWKSLKFGTKWFKTF